MFPARYSIPRVRIISRAGIVFRAILLVPHLPLVFIQVLAVTAGSMVAWSCAVAAARMPDSLWRMQDRAVRYLVRLAAWLLLLTDVRPPFSGRAEHAHAVKVHHDRPETLRRSAAFFRPFLFLPYLFWALPYTLGFVCSTAASLPVVMIAGRRMLWLVIGGEEWLIYMARVLAWACFVIDEYPPYNGVQPVSVHAWFQKAQKSIVGR